MENKEQSETKKVSAKKQAKLSYKINETLRSKVHLESSRDKTKFHG